MQLVKSQAFYENESAFLIYLHMAILISSVAIALMGFSAWARVNPLRHPEVQVVSTQVSHPQSSVYSCGRYSCM